MQFNIQGISSKRCFKSRFQHHIIPFIKTEFEQCVYYTKILNKCKKNCIFFYNIRNNLILIKINLNVNFLINVVCSKCMRDW